MSTKTCAAGRHVQLLDVSSMTAGQATFSMEFLTYRPIPRSVQEEILESLRKEKARESK